MLPDGVYVVETRNFVAGFSIHEGHVVRCAPILRRKLDYWMTRAERVCDYYDPDKEAR